MFIEMMLFRWRKKKDETGLIRKKEERLFLIEGTANAEKVQRHRRVRVQHLLGEGPGSPIG